MVTTFDNPHLYKVIVVSLSELLGWPRADVCDNCKNHPRTTGYYVAAFNLFLCPDCYDEWCQSATEKDLYQEQEEKKYLARAIMQLQR